ncbi:Galectin [Dirofilaria immitis]|nr:Galectin [Dirofilaria immitis]
MGQGREKSNPYKKGDDIDIRIRAHDSKYTIYVDQKEVKEYEHRVPLSSVTHFSIDGDILPVPYESGLSGEGLVPGKSLLIFATPEKKGNAIVRNSLIAGEWGNEEREGKMILEKGIGFDLEIKNEEYAFQIFINSERYATYAHRLDPHEINGLQIGGDLEVSAQHVILRVGKLLMGHCFQAEAYSFVVLLNPLLFMDSE